VLDLTDHHESVQRMIDSLFRSAARTTRLDVVVRAESWELPPEVLEIIELLPPGEYSRQRLCDQLNSAIVAHGWGRTLGTFD